jgi:hypothetical protein
MPDDFRENFAAIEGKEADLAVQSLSDALSALRLRIVHSYEEWRDARWPAIPASSCHEVHALRERATTPPAPQREFLLPLRGGRDGVADGAAMLKDKKVSLGLIYEEETWVKAKPLFLQAAKEFKVAADDIAQLAKLLVDELIDNYGFSTEQVENMRRYLKRFISEVRAGTISLEEEALQR